MRLIKSIFPHYEFHVLNVEQEESEPKCWKTTEQWLENLFSQIFDVLWKI